MKNLGDLYGPQGVERQSNVHVYFQNVLEDLF